MSIRYEIVLSFIKTLYFKTNASKNISFNKKPLKAINRINLTSNHISLESHRLLLLYILKYRFIANNWDRKY